MLRLLVLFQKNDSILTYESQGVLRININKNAPPKNAVHEIKR
jgi:hypothetical protein